jgi:hypothetical protein
MEEHIKKAKKANPFWPLKPGDFQLEEVEQWKSE